MKSNKEAQVVLLPASSMSESYKAPITKVYEDEGKLYINPKEIGELITELGAPQHLYFTVKDTPQEGDWCLFNNERNMPKGKGTKYPLQYSDELGLPKFVFEKIIITTDKSLIEGIKKYPNRDIKSFEVYETLPQPSQQFIEEYIESYNRGKIITNVVVEQEECNHHYINYHRGEKSIKNTSSVWRFKLKINPKDNTAFIKELVKNSWNREELIKAMIWAEQNGKHYNGEVDKEGQLTQFNNYIDNKL